MMLTTGKYILAAMKPMEELQILVFPRQLQEIRYG